MIEKGRLLRLPSLLPAFLTAISLGAVQAHGASDRPLITAPVSHNMCAAPVGWSKPFTHVYHLRNGATLVFVGVEHTQDQADETHRQIKAAFDTYKPGFVLVEGTSATKSVFEWYRNALAKEANERTIDGHASENLYTVKLAVDTGAQFSGWDFSPDQDYKTLIGDGFTITDALGAHLLRSHDNPFSEESSARAVERELRYASTVVPITSFDYATWYRQAYGEAFDPSNGTPCGQGIGSKVVNDLSYRRNLNMTSLIEAHALPGKTILVEAGANHWLAIKDWLESRSSSVT